MFGSRLEEQSQSSVLYFTHTEKLMTKESSFLNCELIPFKVF